MSIFINLNVIFLRTLGNGVEWKEVISAFWGGKKALVYP